MASFTKLWTALNTGKHRFGGYVFVDLVLVSGALAVFNNFVALIWLLFVICFM